MVFFLSFRCGDGSNDVGALRRSHVGLALLSGFGDANTNQMASFEPELEETKGLAVKSAKQVRKEEQERVQVRSRGVVCFGTLFSCNALCFSMLYRC